MSLVPAQMRPTGPVAFRGRPAPDSAKKGLYVAEFFSSDILGYKGKNPSNGPAICTVSGAQFVNNIAVDGKGNFIDPNGGSNTVAIFRGKDMCGPLAGTIAVPYGQPIDAASNNALTGKIAVGIVADTSFTPGSVSVCTMSGGCTINLTNASLNNVNAVAMAKNGDCWADGVDTSGAAHLVYFRRCSGGGLVATGFTNTSYGGLDIDEAGNIVTIDFSARVVRVYSGCNPSCTAVGSAQPMLSGGGAVFGHLNQKSTAFAAGDVILGQVDIYKYNSGTLTYQYSFNNGLAASLGVEGVAYNPRSKE